MMEGWGSDSMWEREDVGEGGCCQLLHTSQQWTPQTIGMAEPLKPISGQDIWTHCPELNSQAAHSGSHSHLLMAMTSAVHRTGLAWGLKRVLLVGGGV